MNLLDLIEEKKVQSQISIKPTQMRLNLDYDYCLANYLKVAESCIRRKNNFLWIDMEDSPFAGSTIDLYTRVLAKFPNTGVAIQAYLKRGEDDINRLMPLGAKIRLAKGAYNENSGNAF